MNDTTTKSRTITRLGEYAQRGDYHEQLDPNWSYYPVYIAKMRAVDKFIQKFQSREMKILDVGCGEGVLVKKYRVKGYNIQGIDLYYSSELVTQGDIKSMPYEDESFDVILCLDTIEHLNYADQEQAFAEIFRVLRRSGFAIFTLPNLAHFLSRLKFLLKGRLERTATPEKHPGDRPLGEYIDMIHKQGFCIKTVRGIYFTCPYRQIVDKLLTKKLADYIFTKLTIVPSLCLLNLILCKKRE